MKEDEIFTRDSSALSRVFCENSEGSIRGRENSYSNESKKSQDKSCFHNHYPDENCVQANKSSKRGNFQDLRFASYLRFKKQVNPKFKIYLIGSRI